MTSDRTRRKALRLSILAAIILTACILFRRTLADALSLGLGGAVIAFLLEPPARLFERKFSRAVSAGCAAAAAAGLFTLALWLLLPALIEEFQQLTRALPPSIAAVQRATDRLLHRLESHFPGISLPDFQWDAAPSLAKNALRLAENIADGAYRLFIMLVLGCLFLKDRDRMLIRLELLIPSAFRASAVKMGSAVCRELRLFLHGQLLICGAVGLLSAAGLAAAGIQPALVLGMVVGLFNIIPYFGPIIGGIPALLVALGHGIRPALSAIAVLWAVQQADGFLISPGIMSSLTGFSPAIVLLALFIGSKLGGMVGLLLTMPIILTFRTAFRVFVQRYESI